MKTLSDSQMRTLEGGWPSRGTSCGFMVGATIGAFFLFGPIAGSVLYMLTPASCALDYALH